MYRILFSSSFMALHRLLDSITLYFTMENGHMYVSVYICMNKHPVK